jgi:Uncharacterised protein family (UPF0236)
VNNILDSISRLLEDGADVKHLEEEVFMFACKLAQELFANITSCLDEALYLKKDKGINVVGFREKTLEMRFGSVKLRRRMYRDNKGKSRYLLDEALGIKRYARISPTLSEAASVMATHMSFRKVADTIASLLPVNMSHMALHTHFNAVAETIDRQDRIRVNALFEDGVIEPADTKKADHLFIEADGVFVSLQREAKKKAEIKHAVCYEGLKPVGKDRFQTVGKITTAGLFSNDAFWQHFSERVNRTYDTSEVKKVHVGGDGAKWIRGGLDLFASAEFVLDRFHLNRALLRSLGPKYFKEAQAKAIAADIDGLLNVFDKALANADSKRVDKINKAKAYIFANKDGLKKELPKRGLGTMEGQIDKTLAVRLKRRGMSWTLSGAHRMARMCELRENGELLERLRYVSDLVKTPDIDKRCTVELPRDPSSWLSAHMPALTGPYSSRTWVGVLREFAGLKVFA